MGESKTLLLPLSALHNSEIVLQHLVGRTEVKTGLGNIVGTSIVPLKLLSAVLKAIHTHFLVESSLINAVLAFYLAVMPWSSNTDPMIDNVVLIKQIFK